ncbi:MAG: hypothetical protein EPN82_04560 [Bacteroidetes bacterium]|nr:MAG: hypothetical protein EPN82_04560 [Bacteroidota bacterium]
MKKVKFLIVMFTVLFTFYVSSIADVFVNGDADKTGSGTFKTSLIDPLSINVVPASGVSDPSLVFSKNATSQVEFNLLDLGYPESEMLTTFQIIGEANHSFNGTISISMTSSISEQPDDVGDGVVLRMTWRYRIGGTGPFLLYDPSISHILGDPMESGPYIGLGEFEIRAYYTDVIIDTDATSGWHKFYQTVTVSYNDGIL